MLEIWTFSFPARVNGKKVVAKFFYNRISEILSENLERVAQEISDLYPQLPSIKDIAEIPEAVESRNFVLVADFEKKELQIKNGEESPIICK